MSKKTGAEIERLRAAIAAKKQEREQCLSAAVPMAEAIAPLGTFRGVSRPSTCPAASTSTPTALIADGAEGSAAVSGSGTRGQGEPPPYHRLVTEQSDRQGSGLFA